MELWSFYKDILSQCGIKNKWKKNGKMDGPPLTAVSRKELWQKRTPLKTNVILNRQDFNVGSVLGTIPVNQMKRTTIPTFIFFYHLLLMAFIPTFLSMWDVALNRAENPNWPVQPARKLGICFRKSYLGDPWRILETGLDTDKQVWLTRTTLATWPLRIGYAKIDIVIRNIAILPDYSDMFWVSLSF